LNVTKIVMVFAMLSILPAGLARDGTLSFIGMKGFWYEKEASPTGQAYHWNTNAETYSLIEEAMGTAMKKLFKRKTAK